MIRGVSYAVCTTNANLAQRRVLSLSGENPAAATVIGILDAFTDEGTQNYRGVRLSIQRRAATGVSFNANYTLSRCFGLEMAINAQFGATYTDPANPDRDRGHCDQDRTHIANATVAAQTPQFGNRILRTLASDWSVSGIFNIRSGSWLSIVTGQDTAFSGISAQRANQVSDDVYGDPQFDAQGRIANYLNRAAFATPAPGTIGNSVRNSIRGPGYWNGIDLAVRRLISFSATQSAELRVEAFNLVNSFNWGNPTRTSIQGSSAGLRPRSGIHESCSLASSTGFSLRA